jgi:hypothetical protein
MPDNGQNVKRRKSVSSLIQIIIKKLSGSMSTRRIIYEWGTCTGAIRRLRFEVVNIEIMQHVFVIKIF